MDHGKACESSHVFRVRGRALHLLPDSGVGKKNITVSHVALGTSRLRLHDQRALAHGRRKNEHMVDLDQHISTSSRSNDA